MSNGGNAGSQVNISVQFQRYVDAKAPPAMRLMAARGLVPAPPRELLHILLVLLHDGDANVSGAAAQTLQKYPEKMIRASINEQTHPQLLDYFCRTRLHSEKLIQDILLCQQLPVESVLFLSEQVNEQLLTIISNNQQRLLMSPEILGAIKKNPVASQGLIDKVQSFLVLNGMITEDASEPTPDVEFPDELTVEDETEEEDIPSWKRRSAKEEKPADDEPDAKNLWGYIDTLGIGDKIKLATCGNATARSILIRSQNKLVAMATIRSPRMTLKEATGIAQNRNVIEEVLRYIAQNKQWLRRYEIVLALTNNPKTPKPISLKMVYSLRTIDLKGLSKNRNVPAVLSKRAKTILNKRTK